MKASGGAFARDLGFVERASYVLILLPVLTDLLEAGRLPARPRELVTEVVLGALIAAYILLLRRTRQELERLEALKRTLTEAVVHDLQNPLAALLASLATLQREELPPETRERFLEVAMRSCKAQILLVETLLDAEKLESAVLVPAARPVDVRELVDGCASELESVAAGLGIRIQVSVPQPAPRLVADAPLLRRVLLNLLHNALKYTAAKGDVSVSVRLGPDGRSVAFEISDTGIGIPPEHLDRLFAKFYRVEGSDQLARRGSGLGLYFCRLAVEAHGGRIGVSSSPGRGTTVFFTIPLGA